MYCVNLDLLHAAARHHPDGRPKDPHAHHRVEHIAARRDLRRAFWSAVMRRLVAKFRPNEDLDRATGLVEDPSRP
jgi:hypothetical protein